MTHFTESTIEQAALDWLKDLGYQIAFVGGVAFENLVSLRDRYPCQG